MKKLLIFTLAAAMLLLGGCGKKAEEPAVAPAATAAPAAEPSAEATATPEPTATPLPQTEEATVIGLYGYAVIEKEARDTEIDVLGDVEGLEDYAVVSHNGAVGLMARQFFRMDGEDGYTSWTGYTTADAKVCSGYDMDDDAPAEPAVGTAYTVVEEFDICYLVQDSDGNLGVIANDELSARRASSQRSSSDSTASNYSDGEDIVMGYEVPSAAGSSMGKAVVLVDDAPLLAGLYEYGDTVQVMERGESVCKLLVNGVEAEIETRFLRFADQTAYESWNGYAGYSAGAFENVRLIGKAVKNISLNTKVAVIEEFDESYLVTVNGEMYYMDKAKVMKYPVEIVVDNSHGEEWTAPIL